MSLKTIRTWETVMFKAVSKDCKQTHTIELTLNHEKKTYEMCSDNQDRLVSIKGTSLVELDLKVEAIKAAANYIKNKLTK